jgi:hypothetical protein
LSAVLQAVTPAFGLMFGHALLDDERFTASQISGLLLGVMGVGVRKECHDPNGPLDRLLLQTMSTTTSRKMS